MTTPKKALALCHAIEAAGASKALTKCSVLASELHAELSKQATPCRACEVFGDGPCSPKAFEKMQDKVARAIHAEHNRHEGQDTPWIALHRFQRGKYRGKAYAALVALGVTAPSRSNTTMSRAQPGEALGGALDQRPPKDKC